MKERNNKYRLIFTLIFILLLGVDSAYAKKHIVSHVKVTCYQPVRKQCDSRPLITSDGSKINLAHLKKGKIKWCAISRDIAYLFPKDRPKRIWIEGFGIYEVRDTMNKRHTHRVDILVHPENKKLISLENVKIKILL